MILVRHRLASGRLDECWDFCAFRRVIDVVLRQASAEPIAFTLPVCAPDRPRIGAFPIMRLDAESWHVLPAIFRLEHEMLVPHDAVIHEALGAGRQLLLTHAPADVDAEIASL